MDADYCGPAVDELMLLNVAETAARLGLGRTKVYELLASGALKGIRIGGARRVPLKAVNDFVRLRMAEDHPNVTPSEHHETGGHR